MIELISINQYRNKKAYYGISTAGINVFLSYSTIIAANTAGVTFITSGYYSNTTAHHKTDAARLYGDKVITARPETVQAIAAGNQAARLEAIQEHQDKETIKQYIKGTGPAVEGLETLINNRVFISEEVTQYKNGNKLRVRTYKTTFKHLENFQVIERTRAIRKALKPYNGPKGPKGKRYYYQHKTTITIREV